MVFLVDTIVNSQNILIGYVTAGIDVDEILSI